MKDRTGFVRALGAKVMGNRNDRSRGLCKMPCQFCAEITNLFGLNWLGALIWPKLWANPLLWEPGERFSRLEAWLYLTNVLAAGKDSEVDSRYRQKHGLTVTGHYSMRDLVEHERMHLAIVRRLDDMCRVVEV